MRVGLIGYGAIAHDIEHYLRENDDIEVIGALVLPEDMSGEAGFPRTTELDEFLSWQSDLVVECAGHGAVQAFAAPVLEANIDLMIISIGALADDALMTDVAVLAKRSAAQVYLPAGALAGVDGLVAARRSGLDYVRIQSVKPPMSWAGAPGVEGIDLAIIDRKTIIFEGSAREAALAFPKNANVAATAAFAGVGLDDTEVELVADPATDRNTHTLSYEGKAGTYQVVIAGNPSPINPKTSQLTALNIVRAIEDKTRAIVIG